MGSVVTVSEVAQVPWKNGAGRTRELMAVPSADGAGFDARVSVADVEQDGPFSDYAGFDRTLLLLEGPRVSIFVGQAAPVRLTPWQWINFPGDAATRSELHGAPVKDLNVITRRGVFRHDLKILAPSVAREIRTGGVEGAVLLVMRGKWALSDGQELVAGQAWCADRGDDRRASPTTTDAAAAWVTLVRLQAAPATPQPPPPPAEPNF